MNPASRSGGMRLAPYWWEDAPRPEPPPRRDLPRSVDVAIVGAGYTGLSAAIVLARAGRGVIVFDAQDAAWGCSARNGGQVSPGVKPDADTLVRRYGLEAARAMLIEGHASLAFVKRFVAEEGLDCDLVTCGRFVGAHRARHYDELARSLERLDRLVPSEWHMVPSSETASELGTGAYRGGAVMPDHAALHPAKFANGLVALAEDAGAEIHTHTPVLGLDSGAGAGATTVTTARGRLSARDVVIATNGYTTALTRGLQRRVIPVGSYIIATEPVGAEVMDEIMPRRRVVSDTRKVVYYYRPSPDHGRVLFGGRVALGETDPRIGAPRLHAAMTRLFPALAETGISHSWMGFVAFTFDHMPHIGKRDGHWYATGYCGSGIAWASYMGHKVGHKVLARGDGDTAFDGLSFPSRPLYGGNPWFLAGAVAYWRAVDRWGP